MRQMILLILVVVLTVKFTTEGKADGAATFTRCAACHTKTGAGVPGAYPPLGKDFRNLAASQEGRRYLALAVIKGLVGPLEVEGKFYSNVMPAQAGLDEAAIADVLNYLGTIIAKSGPPFNLYTSAEVSGYKAGAAALTGTDIARLHGLTAKK